MNKKDSGLYKVILPLAGIILLFFITVFILIIPYIRRSLVETEMRRIKHLVEQQIQTLDSFNNSAERGELTIEQAKTSAAELISRQRYGENREFYYWITDLEPVLLMHPFREDLVDRYVGDFTDPRGNHLFAEMVEIVLSYGEGYLEYVWQLPYDSGTLIDKRSFVKHFEPWDWIIGTGYYIDQLSSEIRGLFLMIFVLSISVMIMVILLSYYIVRQRLFLRRKNLFYAQNFIESEKRYKDLIGRMNEGFVMIDQDFRISMVNQKFLSMVGKPDESVVGRDFTEFVGDSSIEEYRKNLASRKEGRNDSYEIDLKGPSGKPVTVIISPMGMFNEKNEFAGSFAVFTDISKLMSTQRRLKNSLAERDILLKEIHHRVKNNLQIVISLLHIQRMKYALPELDAILTESESRIFSISLVHELLYDTEHLDSISFGEYLDRIIEHLREEILDDKISISYKNSMLEAEISVDEAAAAGILFTELIMELCTHYKNGDRTGIRADSIRITASAAGKTAEFSFTGSYPEVISPAELESRIDLNLVGILIAQLGGESKSDFYRSNGVSTAEFTVYFPINVK